MNAIDLMKKFAQAENAALKGRQAPSKKSYWPDHRREKVERKRKLKYALEREVFNNVLDEVTRATGVSGDEILSGKAGKLTLSARKAATVLAYSKGMSKVAISRQLRQHHTTVMNTLEQPA